MFQERAQFPRPLLKTSDGLTTILTHRWDRMIITQPIEIAVRKVLERSAAAGRATIDWIPSGTTARTWSAGHCPSRTLPVYRATIGAWRRRATQETHRCVSATSWRSHREILSSVLETYVLYIKLGIVLKLKIVDSSTEKILSIFGR